MCADIARWLQVLGRLNVYRARGGPAPHKPLLILVLLEMAEKGDLPAMVLPLTPELAFQFASYWSVVAHRRTQRPDVRLPFYHLQSDGCWNSLREDGGPADSPRSARCAAFNPDFEAALLDPNFRREARRILIESYFEPPERLALRALVAEPIAADEGIDELGDGITFEEARQARGRGRSARFRLDVVAAYKYTCSLTGRRLTTVTAGSLVEAAHIRQFARSGSDEIGNGLALSRDAHWAFDRGLWSLTDEYKVIEAVDCFVEQCPDGRALGEYHGHSIRLPADRRLWPNSINLAWHRNHTFQSG
jgi:putative restriction endonuclease